MASDPLFDRWVLRPRPRPDARVRLFCLPYAGAGASTFYEWPKRLSHTIEMCAIQLPGRENRLAETPYRDSVSLARVLLRVLSPYLDRPFAVFGHSMGALLAFELVTQLAASAGPPPARLFVSASRPPHFPLRRPPMRGASDADLLAEVMRLGGTPAAVLECRELMLLALPTLRADFAVHETHRSEAVVDVPITAFCGTADPEISADEMAAWGARTRAEFQLRVVNGDHFFLRTERDTLVALLVADLDASLNGG